MKMNHEDFGPEDFAGSSDFHPGASAPDRDQEAPPEIEVIEPAADAKGRGGSATLSIDANSVSSTEMCEDRQGAHTRTRVVVVCSRRLAISFEQSWR